MNLFAEPDKKVAADPNQTHVTATWKHARPLTTVRIDPQGKYVFSGAEDNFLVRWNVADGQATQFAGHESWVRGITFSSDGAVVHSVGYDGRWLSWNAGDEKPEPTRRVDAHQGWVRSIVTSPDGKSLATCGNDRLVKLWNAADGTLLQQFEGHESHVYNVAFHPEGQQLVSCDLKANFRVWEISSGKMLREFTAANLYRYDKTFRADIGGARSFAFSLDGKWIAAGGITNVTNAFAGIGNAAASVFEFESGKSVIQHEAKDKVNGALWGLAFHPAGYWIGLSGGGGGGMLYFWKPDAANEFFKFKLPDTGRSLDLAADGVTLAVGHADTNVRLYRIAAKAT